MDVTFRDLEIYLRKRKNALAEQVNSYVCTNDYIKCRRHDLGEPATLPQAYRVFGRVAVDVAQMTRRAGLPLIRWHEEGRENSSYGSNTIFLYRGIPERDLPADLSHEYAHHLQGDSLDILSEGHARGIERMVSQEFSNRHDHFGYLVTAFDRTEDELRWAWAYLFPEETLSVNRLWSPPSDLFKEYMLGTAAFCIAEDEDETIYRKVLAGDSGTFISDS